MRGIGESQPDTCGTNSFHSPYGSDYFYAVHGIMLDRPYVGQRTFDILRVLQWLESFGYVNVHLVAMGWGTIPATCASLLSQNVSQVTLKHPLESYRSVATTEDYEWPLSALLPGVMGQFDLPDCYAALESKGIRLIEPWSAKKAL